MTIQQLRDYLSLLPPETIIKILSADTGYDPVSDYIDPSIHNKDHFMYSETEHVLYIGEDQYNRAMLLNFDSLKANKDP